MPSTIRRPLPETAKMPSEQELEKIEKAIADAVEAISHPAWVMRRLSDAEPVELGEGEVLEPHRRQPEDPVPTQEEIGRLFSFGITLRGYMEELSRMVEDLIGQKTLEDLDYIRVVSEHEEKERENSCA